MDIISFLEEERYQPIFFIKVVPGGVAARSGKLRMGDRLIKVNGNELVGATHRDAVQLLLMPGPTLSLAVRHDPLPLGFQVSLNYAFV